MTARIYSIRTGRECYAPIVHDRRDYAETPGLGTILGLWLVAGVVIGALFMAGIALAQPVALTWLR